jgi:hypothetical protein
VILLFKDHKKMDELIEDYMDCQAKQPKNDQPSPSLVIPNSREGSIFSPAQHSALSTQHSELRTQNSELSTQHSALRTIFLSLSFAEREFKFL